MSQGYVPDTMLVHPMAWLMWVKDPVLREFALRNGGGSFFAQWTGNPASLGNPFYNFGGTGAGQGQTTQATNGAQTGPANAGQLPQNMNAAPVLPGYLLISATKGAALPGPPRVPCFLAVSCFTAVVRRLGLVRGALAAGDGPECSGQKVAEYEGWTAAWAEGRKCVTGWGVIRRDQGRKGGRAFGTFLLILLRNREKDGEVRKIKDWSCG
ncbi:MAG: hypothetical protein KGJ86_08980 [Chloroflexota bacterium]|nr:hypothetical protein [Chloroflexota bacterium]